MKLIKNIVVILLVIRIRILPQMFCHVIQLVAGFFLVRVEMLLGNLQYHSAFFQ